MSQIPTTVFTGFLGSGKTTIIKHLTEELAAKGFKVAYVKNEIGTEDFDTDLIKGEHIETKELLNGCICCTLVGPFMAAIDELADSFQLDRIIIETAGSADPASMALSVSNHPRLLRDGVITIVDVVNFDGYEDLSIVAKRQAELTDLIVFNKVEQADRARKQAVVGYVRELNEKAPIVEAPNGRLNPDVAFGIASANLEKLLADTHYESPDLHKHDHDTHDGHTHESEDGIEAFTFVSTVVFDQQLFLQQVQQFPKTVIRAKGVMQFTDGWKIVNCVYKRCDLQDVPTEKVAEIQQRNSTELQTRLILIGYKINDDAHGLKDLLQHAALPL